MWQQLWLNGQLSESWALEEMYSKRRAQLAVIFVTACLHSHILYQCGIFHLHITEHLTKRR